MDLSLCVVLLWRPFPDVSDLLSFLEFINAKRGLSNLDKDFSELRCIDSSSRPSADAGGDVLKFISVFWGCRCRSVYCLPNRRDSARTSSFGYRG